MSYRSSGTTWLYIDHQYETNFCRWKKKLRKGKGEGKEERTNRNKSKRKIYRQIVKRERRRKMLRDGLSNWRMFVIGWTEKHANESKRMLLNFLSSLVRSSVCLSFYRDVFWMAKKYDDLVSRWCYWSSSNNIVDDMQQRLRN